MEPPLRVAQTGSLLYRGLAIRNATGSPAPADCQSVPQSREQTACLRYIDVREITPGFRPPRLP
jgi:hypothetical protein